MRLWCEEFTMTSVSVLPPDPSQPPSGKSKPFQQRHFIGARVNLLNSSPTLQISSSASLDALWDCYRELESVERSRCCRAAPCLDAIPLLRRTCLGPTSQIERRQDCTGDHSVGLCSEHRQSRQGLFAGGDQPFPMNLEKSARAHCGYSRRLHSCRSPSNVRRWPNSSLRRDLAAAEGPRRLRGMRHATVDKSSLPINSRSTWSAARQLSPLGRRRSRSPVVECGTHFTSSSR